LDQRALRQAFGRFATGVCLAATRDRLGRPVALTINSFTSVSLEPALALWCLGNDADLFEDFAASPFFGVSVLRPEQQALADYFARAADHAIAADLMVDAAAPAPIFRAALASFACTIVARYPAGDHVILVGEIKSVHAGDGDALTYFQSRYGLAPAPTLGSNP